MRVEDKYFQTLTDVELWQRYCSYFDLSIAEFMGVQERLLMEQIETISNSALGKSIMKGATPKSVDEFRDKVPLTKYENYEPYLSEKQDDALSIKPVAWCHSAGRGGQFKWLPYGKQFLDITNRLFVSYLIMSAANRKGEINIGPGERVIMHIPPRPYASWTMVASALEAFTVRMLPPLADSEEMPFKDRVQKSFQMALKTGVDEIASISSVMVKIGETMATQAQMTKLSLKMMDPRILWRLGRGILVSKLHRRNLLPKDIWKLKAIICGGADTSIYKETVAHYWGIYPYEMYGSTEVPTIAVQNWNKKWLTFVPYMAFWEFIPEDESIKSKENPNYKPSTVLIDALKPGKVYEVVLTHFYGMPLVRYRIGDAIKVMALQDEETGVTLPQIIFHSRVGETIDLAGLARLTERVIWQALKDTGIPFEEWTVRKEYVRNQSILHFYVELKPGYAQDNLTAVINETLKKADIDYQDLDKYLAQNPIRVTVLKYGTFANYYGEMEKAGADLAHLKPPHTNASDSAIQRLVQLGVQSQ